MTMSMTAAGEGGEEDSGSDGSDMRIFRDDEDKNVSHALMLSGDLATCLLPSGTESREP